VQELHRRLCTDVGSVGTVTLRTKPPPN
jgi:hypothetical protein